MALTERQAARAERARQLAADDPELYAYVRATMGGGDFLAAILDEPIALPPAPA